jgi:dihydrofolate synthase/folylpolyglutamate synthase
VEGELALRGRLEVLPGEPPHVLDAAHNAEGARALAEALPEVSEGNPVVACVALLEGKDDEGFIRALAPALAHAVCTELPPERLSGSGRPEASSVAARRLAALCEAEGLEAEAVPDLEAARARARELAAQRSGIALSTGSHYLL